jgi:formate hydrogenlyase subunit 3/multisubunit Na+/H+ antiporter MnhD subunit
MCPSPTIRSPPASGWSRVGNAALAPEQDSEERASAGRRRDERAWEGWAAMQLLVLLTSTLGLFATSGYAIVARKRNDIGRRIYRLSAALCLLSLIMAVSVLAAPPQAASLPIGLPWIGMNFRLDSLSAFFLALVDLGGVAASVYAIGYGAHEKDPSRILPFFCAFLAAMNAVLMADDAFVFLVAWELMSLTSWALVLAHHRSDESRSASFIYLVMASFGTLALLMAFGLLAGSVGGYEFSTIRAAAHAPWIAGVALALMIVGAGSKAGLAPLHVWLPLAHPAAPSHVSALMSGVMTKVAIYGFVRVVFDLLGPPAYWWSVPLLVLGAGSTVLGVLYLMIESDLKKLLAYSTIENIGIVFVALGLALAFKSQGFPLVAALAFTAALYHALNHSLFKSLLFFVAGAVQGATGERDIERLGGLIHKMPRTAFLALGGCIAISALPPLNGFVSEWLVFQSILLSPSLPQWSLKLIIAAVGGALALSAALCAGGFVRAYGVAFLGRARSEPAKAATEPDDWSLGAMAGLSLLCLLAGLLPSLVIGVISPTVNSVIGAQMPSPAGMPFLSIAPVAESRSSYNGIVLFIFIVLSASFAARVVHRFGSHALRRGAAWDCGYPDPAPSTQYTASSFSQPIRRVFANAVFLARDHVDMPAPGDTRPARFSLNITDRVMDNVYRPISTGVMFCSAQLDRFHFLPIQGYLTLVFVALIVLLSGIAIWQ